MTLELEANNKIDAERKARSSGMDVQHIEDITPGHGEHHGSRHRGHDRGPQTGIHPVIKTLVILALVAVVAWFGWPYLRSLLGR